MASVTLARVYQQSFEHRPYWTLAITNGALNALGDTVAQLTEAVVRQCYFTRLPPVFLLTALVFEDSAFHIT